MSAVGAVELEQGGPNGAAAALGRTLVFGASGYVGTNLVPRLQAVGVAVRAASRDRAVLEARDWAGVELAQADALQPDTLATALAGIDTAYYLVHSMAAGAGFASIDLQAARNFAAAASAAGVRRVVYLGGLVPEGADSDHLRSRAETGAVLRQGTVPVIELRAGIIVGAGSAAYEVMRDLVFHLPIMVTPRWVQSRSTPIALANLLDYLVRLPALSQAEGGIFDAGGPELLSYEQMLRRFGAIVGRHPRILPVPVLSPGLSSYWLALVTSVPSSIGRALVGGLKHDIPAHDGPLRALVPQPLTGFDDAVRAALEAERTQKVLGRWTEGAFAFRGQRHDVAFYAKRAGGSAVSSAPPAAVWRVLTALGGDTGYYYMNFLWWLREFGDWLVGGPGFSQGRRDPHELRLGDTVDYWTVVGIEPERRLTLNFGLKGPGAGVLEFELTPLPDGSTRITETAYWHPQGVWGLLYWYALVPAHLFIFKGMTRAMARRAEG